MRARWVLNNPSPEPWVGYSIVAGWWPTTYLLVCTLLLDSASSDGSLAVLRRQLGDLFPNKGDEPVRDYYETRVFKCDSQGYRKSPDYVLFKRQYADLEQARIGHKETVDRLMQRKLRLKQQRLYPDLWK